MDYFVHGVAKISLQCLDVEGAGVYIQQTFVG